MAKITAPAPLTARHNVETFSCGDETLNDWLKRHALKNETIGASRTYVICDGKTVIGYYALATGSVEQEDVPGKVRRNMPDPIPVIVLGRLAVDSKWQNQQLGEDLLQDAIKRTVNISIEAGVKALLVHAISDKAKSFYINRGFIESPTNEMTLILPLKSIVAHLG